MDDHKRAVGHDQQVTEAKIPIFKSFPILDFASMHQNNSLIKFAVLFSKTCILSVRSGKTRSGRSETELILRR
jgi:hypothetical protein